MSSCSLEICQLMKICAACVAPSSERKKFLGTTGASTGAQKVTTMHLSAARRIWQRQCCTSTGFAKSLELSTAINTADPISCNWCEIPCFGALQLQRRISQPQQEGHSAVKVKIPCLWTTSSRLLPLLSQDCLSQLPTSIEAEA